MGRFARIAAVFGAALLMGSPVGAEPKHAADVSPRDSLFDVALRGDHVLVVGYPGLLLLSEDRGARFRRVDVGTSQALFAIDVLDDGRGVVVGRSGLVLTTADGGRSWTRRDSGTDASLFDVDMTPDGQAWAVGHFGTILHSADAGATWTEQTYDPELAAAEDGAEDPVSLSVAEEENEGAAAEARLNGVAFASGTFGFVVGEFGIVLVTRDGGTHWTRIAVPSGKLLFDVVVTEGGRVAVVGAEGTWITSDDAGQHWQVIESGTGEHLLAVCEREQRFAATSYDGQLLLQGADGSVEVRSSGASTWVGSVAFADPSNGLLAGGNGSLWKTRDGGKSFERLFGETTQ